MRKVGLLLGVLAGCGGSLDTSLLDGSSGNDAGPDATMLDTGTVDVTVQDVAPDSPCANMQPTCSADLHSVIDCQGNVITMCPADQACSAGACMPACGAMAGSHHYSGCEFYSVVPDVISGLNLEGGCYVVSITNDWTSPMTVTVDRAGTTLSGSFIQIPSGSGKAITYAPPAGGTIAPGATALLFLSQSTGANPACPTGITPATTVDPAVHGTAYGSAFHITTTMPAVASDYVPYGATAYIASASMLLPTSVWDTSYVVVDGYTASTASQGQPSTMIVAMEDGTQVDILPTVNIAGSGTVTSATAGSVAKYTLSKGQSLQFTQAADLTGSIVSSNNPIAVWGAHSCLNIDPSATYCDSAHQELPPVRQLGHDYVGVRYRNRTTTEETPPWRLVGAVDGTTLTWDPPMTGAPPTLKAGELQTINAAGPFRVTSQDTMHPFYLSAHMTGGSAYSGYGDPEFVNVIPADAWRGAYTFFTQPGFPESSVVLVRSSAMGGFQDVTLDCAGTLTGWTAVGTSGLYEYTRLDLSTGNFGGVGKCDNGVHTATSSAPFTLTTWGWGNTATTTYYVSYALPAGMATH